MTERVGLVERIHKKKKKRWNIGLTPKEVDGINPVIAVD